MENDEVGEEKFYEVVEIADNEYYDLGGQIGELLENYFVSIYRELIEVEE
ncbi:MAG: hypothetical protein LRY73_09635 [Bacillus sp. (in: Bacteria)]|nr:hypothetical protein [Bacillus sp. (in: firmicutes)]